MKSLFLLLAATAITTTCLAQNTGFNLSKVIKPGTVLVYDVWQDSIPYELIIIIKDKKGSSYKWEMTEPISKKGSVTHTAKALLSATGIFPMFTSGNKKLDDKTTSLWLSQHLYNQLSKAGVPVKVWMDGPKKPPTTMGTFTGSLDNEISVSGKEVTVSEELVKVLVKQGKDWVPGSSESYFTFYPDKTFPLILRMDTGPFVISLKEVR
jgi:hypothetical protein